MRRFVVLPLALLLLVGGVVLARGDVPCEVLAAQPSCHLAIGPGPTEDVLQLVEVDGVPAYASTGQLLLTTVAVRDDLTVRSWLDARRSRVVDAVPRDTLYPPGSDRASVAEQNAALMADSQLVATIAALTAVGYELEGDGALVAAVTEDAVTDELAPGDVIVAVDGEVVRDNRDVVAAVQASAPGSRLTLDVVDDVGPREVVVQLGSAPDGSGTAYVGVLLTTELDLPVDVTIDAGVIGGPSAGLMFALSIVDVLGPEDLTGGAVIAGTGIVDRDGTVRPVGGVRQKVVAATEVGADERRASVFLVPRANLDDARSAAVSREVLLVPVDTLDDALEALEDLRNDREPTGALALGAGR